MGACSCYLLAGHDSAGAGYTPSGRLSGQPPRKEEENGKMERAIAPRKDPDNQLTANYWVDSVRLTNRRIL